MAIDAGFRVTTNSTLFNNANPETYRKFFDTLMELGVEGMMISPGYPYEKSPDQEHFLHSKQAVSLFRKILSNPKPSWKFNQSPLFLEFLKGNWNLECAPWGNPTYNIFGWQRPCYLLQDGYATTFQELLETTDWNSYGRKSGNPKCVDCMVHCGYEPAAIIETFGSLKGLVTVARVVLTGPPRKKNDDGRLRRVGAIGQVDG